MSMLRWLQRIYRRLSPLLHDIAEELYLRSIDYISSDYVAAQLKSLKFWLLEPSTLFCAILLVILLSPLLAPNSTMGRLLTSFFTRLRNLYRFKPSGEPIGVFNFLAKLSTRTLDKVWSALRTNFKFYVWSALCLLPLCTVCVYLNLYLGLFAVTAYVPTCTLV